MGDDVVTELDRVDILNQFKQSDLVIDDKQSDLVLVDAWSGSGKDAGQKADGQSKSFEGEHCNEK